MQTINLVLQAEVHCHRYENEVIMVLQYCYCEANFYADFLAKKGVRSDIAFVLFSAPVEMYHLLLADTSFLRG